MQDAPGERVKRHGPWRRLKCTALWPVLLAEIGFTIACLGVGVLVWLDVAEYQQQERQQQLLSTYRLQARLLDQQLANQQHYLRQLGRATRRLLQDEPTPPSVVLPSIEEESRLVSPSGDMAVLGSASAIEGQGRDTLARQLHRLEPLMSDFYQGDALIERLYVSLPQGLVAMVPDSEMPEQLTADWLGTYPFDTASSQESASLRWRTIGGDGEVSRLELRLDIVESGRQARLGLELDTGRLAQLMQEYVGAGRRSSLVGARGETLLGERGSMLPDDAGRRGVMPLYTADGQPMLLIWATLPTTGWRLVSLHPATQGGWMAPSLGWVALVWAVGSLLILALLLMQLRYRMQRWESRPNSPMVRVARIQSRLAALLPSWLARVPEATPTESLGGYPTTSVEEELDALEAVSLQLASQPKLQCLLGELGTPAALTRDGTLMMANPAFEQLVGRTQAELKGTACDLILAADASGDENQVRVLDGEGHWRRMRREWSRDGQGFGLILLIDESEFQQHAQQLSQARDRARQDSQLKTRYLALLRRELDALASLLEKDGVAYDAETRERLSGLMEMLDRLSDDTDSSSMARGEAGPFGETTAPLPRVLIVDDGPVNTALAHNVLSRYGLSVDTARGGEEALSLADRQFYDLVFMDIFMPAPDGIETSRRWRERELHDGAGRRSVLIALTANASEIDREQFSSVGMDDCLAKPYRPQALIDMIHRWLPGVALESP